MKLIIYPTCQLRLRQQKINSIMRIVVQIVQNYLKQEIPSIIITTDKNKYLFNVPASFQRFTREHGQKFPYGARFFFTKTCVSSIAGLTGLLLSMFGGVGNNSVKLYTDDKMFRYLEELRYKMGYKSIPVSYCSLGGKLRKGLSNSSRIEKLTALQQFDKIFDNMNEYININIQKKEQNNAFDYYNPETSKFKDQDMTILPFVVDQNQQLLTNFIIAPGDLPGRLLPEKLKQFGITGKNIGALSRDGKVVIAGQTIQLHQCKEQDTPAPNVILLHYSRPQTISLIMSNQRLVDFLADKNNYIYSVVHIVENAQAIYSPQFKQLLGSFPQYTEHLVYNHQFRNSTDKPQDLFRLSAQVKQISTLSQYFPLCLPNLKARHQQYIKKELAKLQAIDELYPEFKVTCYKRFHELVIAPKKSWGYKLVVKGDSKEEFMNEETMIPEVEAELEPAFVQKFKQINPKVVFLGTGSMKPSKYRNVSSIMIEWLPKFNIMMDCGEGSHIQLIDHYGYENYEEVIINIRTIFITHIHSDHNLGLLDLISLRTRLLKERNIDVVSNKLYLILPANVVPWYHSFCSNVQNLNEGCSVLFIQALRKEDYTFEGTMSKQDRIAKQCKTKVKGDEADEGQEDQLTFIKPQWNDILKWYFQKQQDSLNEFQSLLSAQGIQQFFPCPVIHCPQSYGICITHASGVKISYSGDTRPCKQFAKAASDSTILIHEATFGDDLARNAYDHYHSTVGEALDIAMESKSWKLALTHFSQRYKSASDIVDPLNYSKNPIKKSYSEKHTIVCFDHLEIESSKAHILPEYTRALAAAIPKDVNE